MSYSKVMIHFEEAFGIKRCFTNGFKLCKIRKIILSIEKFENGHCQK